MLDFWLNQFSNILKHRWVNLRLHSYWRNLRELSRRDLRAAVKCDAQKSRYDGNGQN